VQQCTCCEWQLNAGQKENAKKHYVLTEVVHQNPHLTEQKKFF
jgi:hypothetical protein